MPASHRHVVLGAGAIGSAVALRLAERGDGDVLVLDRYPIGHDRGSSSDSSRIIRHAYHSSAYTALTPAAFDRWADVERRTGLQLVHRTGGLDLFEGPAGAADLAAYRTALDASGIGYELLDAAGVRARFPQWRLDDGVTAMLQADAGILDIRRATAAQVALARQLGVRFAGGTRALGVDLDGPRIAVRTETGTVHADRLVLATGSWAGELLGDLGVAWPITLTQEQVSWFATPAVRDFLPDRFPVWVHHAEQVHYGFPVHGEVAVKLGRDTAGPVTTSEGRTWDPDPAEARHLAGFLERHLPTAAGPELVSRTCLYDLTPDKEFVVDLLPGDPRVAVAVGGSGHAGKFAALLGEVVADLLVTGATAHPVDLFRADRPALTDPGVRRTTRLSTAR